MKFMINERINFQNTQLYGKNLKKYALSYHESTDSKEFSLIQ